jgi:hypothetical protein
MFRYIRIRIDIYIHGPTNNGRNGKRLRKK